MIMTSQRRRPVRVTVVRAAVAFALAAFIGGAATSPARAGNDDNGWHGRGPQEARHDDRDRYRWHEREWHDDHPNVYVAPNYYAYAPPPVVYAPPPVPPSLNFVFPLGR
jgi:hypothetical protein